MSKIVRAVCMIELPVEDSDNLATLDEKLQAIVNNITSQDFVFLDDDDVEIFYDEDLDRFMGRDQETN